MPLPVRGNVVIRLRFTQFTGRFVFHCHIINHEDGGMMAVVEIYDPRKSPVPAVSRRPGPASSPAPRRRLLCPLLVGVPGARVKSLEVV